MDDHIQACEELFSAARSEFKHLEHFYFHNCVYEGVWKDTTAGTEKGCRPGMSSTPTARTTS